MLDNEFDGTLKKSLEDTFSQLGYKFSDGCFYLNRCDGFRNLVSFDFDGKNSFRVFVGIDYPYDKNYDESAPPEGARYFRYFTGGSLSSKPRDFFFKDCGQLDKHLERFRNYFKDNIVKGFFAAIKSAEDYADALPTVECIVKYEIYKKELLVDKAVKEAEVILNSYKNMMDIPKIKAFMEDDVKLFLEQEKNLKK